MVSKPQILIRRFVTREFKALYFHASTEGSLGVEQEMCRLSKNVPRTLEALLSRLLREDELGGMWSSVSAYGSAGGVHSTRPREGH